MERERVIAIFTLAGEGRVLQALREYLQRHPDSFPYGLLAPIHRTEDLQGFASIAPRGPTEPSSDSSDDKRGAEAKPPDQVPPSRPAPSSDFANPALARAQAIQAYVFYLVVDGLAKRNLLPSDQRLLASPSDEALAHLRTLSPAILRSAVGESPADID